MKTNAKPYATHFTFDPVDGTICYKDRLDTEIVIAIAHDCRTPRERATAQLLASAPGALAECVEALEAVARLIRTARKYFPGSIKNSDRFDLENANATTCAALTKAEAVLNPASEFLRTTQTPSTVKQSTP